MTYAGGELSEHLSSNSFSSTDSGSLFDEVDGVEDTANINRKNRLFFGLGMLLALGLGAYLFGIGPLSEESEGLTQQELDAEELLAEIVILPEPLVALV